MNEQELDHEEKCIPRWLQILVGAIFGIVTLFCTIGSILLIISPNEKAPVFAPVTGMIMLLVSFWILVKCFHLVLGRKSKEGLLSPKVLRAVAVILLLMLLGGIFTGYFKEKPIIALIQSWAYVLIFFQLRRLAAERESKQKSLNDSVTED